MHFCKHKRKQYSVDKWYNLELRSEDFGADCLNSNPDTFIYIWVTSDMSLKLF